MEALDNMDAQPEIVNPELEQQPDTPEPETQPAPPADDPQERNWKAARARLDETSKENRLLKQQMDLMARELELIRQSAPKAEPEEEEFLTDSERKLAQKIKALESRIETHNAKEADYVMDRLRAKYPDFDEVVSVDNVEYLQTNNAALAKAIASLKADPYQQGLAAYDALKRTEFYAQRHTMQDKAKLEENSKKPLSVQAVRKQGALAEANRFAAGLTPELKKQLVKEMADARKGA